MDGQQRLTTLWLIHWFIAYKEGKIEVVGSNESHELILNQVGKTLKKFSYETRDSSRDFCQKIIEYAAREKYSDSQNHFKEKIQSNIWFYKSWQHDPTIKAMLTMIQAIENRFKDSEKKYWDLLSGPYCPIVFFEIDLIENNLSDDLYIKMNARGKALSSFENFKADFIGFLQLKDREGKIDHYLFEPNNGIPIKMDTAWTDIFWENRSNNCDIDEIYFAFFNRFFFNEYLVSVNNSQGLESSELYKYFYGVSNSGSDDTLIAYKSFDYYKQILEPNPNMVKTLFNTLNNIKAFHNLNKLLVSEGIPELFSFIPRYLTDNDGKNVECYDFAARKIKKTSGIEQRLRPIFYAICKFFEFQDCTDEISEGIAFHRWIRVCKNLIADPRLRNVDALRSILLTIKELSPFSHAIYEHLSSLDFSNTESPSILESQLIEECEKASHILLNPDSETLIEEIEQMAFFNGQIRFVYRDESWNIDWEDVPRKIQTIQNVFSDKGVRDVSFIAKFVSLFTKIYQLNETFKISLRASAWMETLLNPQYCDVIHNILLCNDMNTEEGFKSQLDFGDIEISDERKRMIIKASMRFVPLFFSDSFARTKMIMIRITLEYTVGVYRVLLEFIRIIPRHDGKYTLLVIIETQFFLPYLNQRFQMEQVYLSLVKSIQTKKLKTLICFAKGLLSLSTVLNRQERAIA